MYEQCQANGRHNLCFPREEEPRLGLDGQDLDAEVERMKQNTLNVSVQIPGPHLGLCCPVQQPPAHAAVAHLKHRHAGGVCCANPHRISNLVLKKVKDLMLDLLG